MNLATYSVTDSRPTVVQRPERHATVDGPCHPCDHLAARGVEPGTITARVISADGTTVVHRVPDQALNDLFCPGSRSVGRLVPA